MAIGLVVLIALACALGATFLLVVGGILVEGYRRKMEGYTIKFLTIPTATAVISFTAQVSAKAFRKFVIVIFPEYLKRRNRLVISALARTP